MTDAEFIDAIKMRLWEKGWHTGTMGLPEGPNCLLGAAGYVAHNDLVVDDEGVIPLAVDGHILSPTEQDYEYVPGMVRLAKILGLSNTYHLIAINDSQDSLEDVLDIVDAFAFSNQVC